MLKPTPMKLERYTDDGDAVVIKGNISFLTGTEVGDTLLVVNAGKRNWPGKVTTADIWGAKAVDLQQKLDKALADYETAMHQLGRVSAAALAFVKADDDLRAITPALSATEIQQPCDDWHEKKAKLTQLAEVF